MISFSRRNPRRLLPVFSACGQILFAAVFGLSVLAPAAAQGFSINDVAVIAKKLAAEPYHKPENKLPKDLQDLDYDQYRDIRFKPDQALWHAEKLPFELQFFHQGRFFDRPVKINEITPSGVHEVKFTPDDFDYGANKLDTNHFKGLGFGGFRVHFPLNNPKYKDEVLVFQGASYFRALGKGQRYGLSARGLAVDTALISGEEFPRFSEFWLVRPEPNAKELVVYALLNSRRMTGAYRFVLKPGAETAMETQSRIYLRENVSKLGIAPLTSMYFFADNQHIDKEDYRPEVHDSDGLSIAAGTGEWIWRPLVNPKRLLVTSFSMSNPQGFGLMQRDRLFDHYQDLEARYELRPSVWVEPKGTWGAGRVELVQIPTPDETNDNIVAYWVPDTLPAVGEPLEFDYRLLWQLDKDKRPPLSWVAQTRRGRGFVRNNDGSIGFALDFEGPALERLSPDAKIEGVVTVDGNGELLERQTFRNDATGGWRLSLRLKRVDNDKPVELRAYLRSEDTTLSETWSYILPPS
ncbi:MAG: glucan biosynthesis protein G [Nevskia sp.]|nr:glucan biosynthesis protein G [Nevskia sp.]MCK9386588.1 glucan biosynthesis protein G [Nevskia sp.]